MTSPTMPQAVAVSPERARRILSIAANLLPMEIVETRRERKVRRAVVTAVAVFLVLLTGWYGFARYQSSTASGGLATAEADVAHLQSQQAAYAGVVSVQAESLAINTALSGLLANDLPWPHLLAAIRAAAPAGVDVGGVSGVLSQLSAGGPGALAVQLPHDGTGKSIGSVTVTGSATSKATVAAYVDALGKVPGLAGALVSSTTVTSGVLEFTIRVDIIDSALAGRYTPKSANGSGVK